MSSTEESSQSPVHTDRPDSPAFPPTSTSGASRSSNNSDSGNRGDQPRRYQHVKTAPAKKLVDDMFDCDEEERAAMRARRKQILDLGVAGSGDEADTESNADRRGSGEGATEGTSADCVDAETRLRACIKARHEKISMEARVAEKEAARDAADAEKEDAEADCMREDAVADRMRATARAVEQAFQSDGSSDEEEDDGVGPSRGNKKRRQKRKKSAGRKARQKANKKNKRLEVAIPYTNLFRSYLYIT